MKRRLLLALSIIPLLMLVGGAGLVMQIKRHKDIVHHVQSEVIEIVRLTEGFATAVEQIRAELWRAEAGEADSLDRLVAAVEAAEAIHEQFKVPRDLRSRKAEPNALGEMLARFKEITSRIATSRSPELRQQLRGQLIDIAGDMKRTANSLRDYVTEHAEAERQKSHTAMKIILIAAFFTFMAPLLVSIFIIRQVVEDVTRPVSELVMATERLGEGDLSYRVTAPLKDEFNVLATSFNEMAENLAQAELRRVEAARQVSVTLQHHINNSLAALVGLSKRVGALKLPRKESYIAEGIDSEVDKMRQVMQKLGELQEIVTIEYARGIHMVDPEAGNSDSAGETEAPGGNDGA